MSDHEVQLPQDAFTPSPGIPGEGWGGGLLSEPGIVDLAQPSAPIGSGPPRPTFLQRFASSRASTLTSLFIALALHAALLSLAYVYYATTKTTELPTLPLPRGFATESADATPTHPTVTFSEAPTPLGHNDPAAAPFTDPVAKDLLKPLPADFAPPQASTSLSTDLTVGPADLPAPTGAAVPPPPHRTPHPTPLLSDAPGSAADPSASPRPPDALRNPLASAATPGGTPDVPPTPSARNKVPPYPPDALRRRLAGTVLLELHIADSGRVTDAVIQQSSGHDLLDQSARDTALTWTFTPARLEGRPVPITVLRPVNFIPPREPRNTAPVRPLTKDN